MVCQGLKAVFLVFAVGLSACIGPAHNPGVIFYTVKPGDTLYSIGQKNNLSSVQLAYWNKLSSPYIIYPGQKIVIRKTYKELVKSPYKDINQGDNGLKRTYGYKYSKNNEKKFRKPSRKKAAKPVDIEWSWPIDGNIVEFFTIGPKPNKGIDIAGDVGDPVKSAANGRVVYTGSALLGYGKLVIVRHNAEMLTAYGNNDRVIVKEGDSVKAGQKIAEIGSSEVNGNSQLHFEIRQNGTPVNPLDYLP